jgi:hypothetical protein
LDCLTIVIIVVVFFVDGNNSNLGLGRGWLSSKIQLITDLAGAPFGAAFDSC